MSILAANVLSRWLNDPVAFVVECIGETPDRWQQKALQALVNNRRIAIGAAKSAGKSRYLCYVLCWWTLLHPHSRTIVISSSATQLRDTAWSDLASIIANSPILNSVMVWQTSRVIMNESPSDWWISARALNQQSSISEQNASLAGLHGTVCICVDESGTLPLSLSAVCEAALATAGSGSGGAPALFVQAGNTLTRSNSMLYAALATNRSHWWTMRVTGDPDDPERAERISVDWCREQISLWSRNSSWVKTNVFAEFPEVDIASLISMEDCERSMARNFHESDVSDSALVCGVDTARGGADSSVITLRRGVLMYPPIQLRDVSGTEGAGRLARMIVDKEIDAVMIDNTGGWGGSWLDNLQRLGHAPIPVGFAEKPFDGRFLNRRAEMIFSAARWVRDIGRLPPGCGDLIEELTQVQYQHSQDKLMIESKQQIRERLGRSCDFLDSLALTFAAPVVKKGYGSHSGGRFESHYEPMSEGWNINRETDRKRSWMGLGKWS